MVLLVLCALAAQDPAVDRDVRPFLEEHCTDCHDADARKGGLDLEALRFDAASLPAWTKVFDRVRTGEMPPKKKARPPQAGIDRALGALAGPLRRADLDRQRREGRVVARRLNRIEYETTLRDLLHLPHLQVAQMLPPDTAAGGFDNVSEAQDVSYVQIARYLDAARRALDEAMCLREAPERRKGRIRFQDVGRFCGKGTDPKTGRRVERGETRHVDEWVVFLRQPNSAQTPWRVGGRAIRDLPAGQYRFRIRARGVVYDNGRLIPQDRNHVGSLLTQEKRLLRTFDIPAEPGVIEFTAWLYEGDSLEFFCASLDDRNTCGAGTPKGPYTGPGLAVDWLEVEGPLGPAWPWKSRSVLFAELPMAEWTPETGLHRPERTDTRPPFSNRGPVRKKDKPPWYHIVSKQPLKDAERLLRRFMLRAYRRPVEESEVQRCLAFARAGIEKKQCFQDAMRTAYLAALCSPDFLYLQERPGPLDGRALAARLSYYIWRSLPDEELLRLADAGELSRPEVLGAQVDRLLDDPRAARFVSDFTGQWLDLREIQFTVPDKLLYPEYFCDNHLVESMVRETEATFAEMVRRDLGAAGVLDSDFLMINERLARLYNIPGVKGCSIRRVAVPKGSVRGGLLTQGSVLKVTANGLTTSPVLRGKWIQERLLGMHIPPPPPNAGSIDPDTRGATTIREQLEKHRRSPSCAACHVKIDPPGFALERFDVMGKRRDWYRSAEQGEPVAMKVADRQVRYKHGPGVDSTGMLPDGRTFASIGEFRRHLLRDREQLARNLVERFLTFATGAAPSFADREVVEEILKRTAPKGYGVRSLIREVVLSRPFRCK